MTLKIKPNKKIHNNELIKFEEKNKIILLKDYKSFLLEFNGGCVDRNRYDFITYAGKPYYFELTYLNKLTEIKIILSENWVDFLCISYAHGGIGFESYIGFSIKQNQCTENIFLCEAGEGEVDVVSNNFTEFLNNFKPRFDNKFEELCDAKDFDGLTNLIKNGFDVNTTNRYGYKVPGIAWHYYTYYNKKFLEIIKLMAFLTKENNLDIRPDYGELGLFEILEEALANESWFNRLNEYEKRMYKEIYEILKNKGKN
jgi:hypothetical protein